MSDYPRDASIHELFLRQAAANPDAPAVSDPTGTVTYAELAGRSARLASRLTGSGVSPGDLVAVRARPGIGWVVADLAVLRAGGAFLPINPDDPEQRVRHLLDDAGVRLVLGDDERADAHGGRTELAIGADLSGAGPLPERVPATSPAYVMYTSGSTGRPKGVVVCHRNVVRLVTGTDYVSFSPRMRLLQTGAVSFDATTFEVWGPLLNGGTVVVPERDAVLDAERLAAVLTAERITTMWLTSPLFSRLARQEPAAFATLRELVVGGDVVDGRHVAAVLAVAPGLRVVNGYGPTENTTFSATHHITAADTGGDIPIGLPIAHSTAYVLADAGSGTVAAPGEEGELYVGGDGVALGYLNRPELTSRVFVPDPFRPGERMYRTGDRARRRPDGVIEFLGRTDGQVKIRGFRIEPGEVEAVLREHTAVADVIVVPREHKERPGERYLCAYLTAHRPVDAAELREHLAVRVPRHLIPGHLVLLDELPLSAHGKVDRGLLPDPEELYDLPVEFVAARDETEERLVALTERVLPGVTVGVLDSVFDHGLDSLGAATLASSVSKEFAARVSTADVFRNPSVAEVAALLAERGSEAPAAGIAAPAGPGRFPLTPQQYPLYAAQTKDPASVQYNVPIVLELPAGTDADRLADAWRALVRRHDALRTSFADGPVQVVHAEVTADVAVTGAYDPSVAPEPFDLAAAPPVRARIHRGDGRVVLAVDLHHIVVDGLSLARLFADLDALYRGAEPEPVTSSYADYSRWVTGDEGRRAAEEQRSYWEKAFDGWRPPPELPLDRPRPAVRTNAGAVHEFVIPQRHTAALRAIAARQSTTLFAPLAAAYAVFLAAITATDDVTVGVPVSGRTMPGSETAVGMFVNTVCLRLRPHAELRFTELVEQASARSREAFAHQDLPLTQLTAALQPDRRPGRNAVFDTMLALQSGVLHRGTFGSEPVELRPRFPGQTMFDLNLQVYEHPDRLDLSWEYSTELLDAATVGSFAGLLLDVLDRALADPHLPVAALTGTGPAAPPPAADAPRIDFDL